MDLLNQISDNSETLFLPLYARAFEAKTKNPIIEDPKAIEITEKLNDSFRDSDKRLHKKLRNGKLPSKLPISLSLRSRKFDQYAINFMERHPDALIISMGCGLDTRFERVDNGKAIWIDVDFPEVIDIRKTFFPESGRKHFIGESVTSEEWIPRMHEFKDRPTLFIAEGLFMYLEEEDVKDLLLRLHDFFPFAELACEVTGKWIVDKMVKPSFRKRFQRKNYLGKDAVFSYGVNDGHDFEAWHTDFKLLEEWTYFDEKHPKMGWMNWFGYFEFFRKVQWVVYYKISG